LQKARERSVVGAYDRLFLELHLLHVALVEELVGDELGHAVLHVPGFGDGADVARRHHHPRQHWKRQSERGSRECCRISIPIVIRRAFNYPQQGYLAVLAFYAPPLRQSLN
jgi:hypothetical protein